MLFNSIEFAIFLPIVFLLYWFATNKYLRAQNLILLFANYIFYGFWDWRFLSILAITSTVDYFVGLALSKQKYFKIRKRLLLLSIFINIGVLCFFKYYNFFVESVVDTFSIFGQKLNFESLDIILPIGISFYTFQKLSYTIDVYNKKIKPTKDVITFFLFTSFFPLILAGPIERASNLLPQFNKRRRFDYREAVDGMRQILWGLFKKIVVADNCATYVNNIFTNYTDYPGSVLLLGAFYFAIQIYCDFSGYSDIAVGTSKLFGFKIIRNFANPYFSRDIAEFWRRWHISLTSWFKDYVYIPLGGSHGSNLKTIRNTFIIFVVCGFWHGANWTFIAWGFINACYFIPLLLLKQNRRNINIVAESKSFPSIKEVFQISITFFITMIAWIFFRADSLTHAFGYIFKMLQPSLFSIPNSHRTYLPVIAILVVVEWLQRDKQHALQIDDIYKPVRWGLYYAIFLITFLYGGSQQQFIYFQF